MSDLPRPANGAFVTSGPLLSFPIGRATPWRLPRRQVLMSQTLRHAKVAYLSGVIPALSETFIYREIFEVERRGYILHLYALHRPNRGTLSADSLPLCDRTYYLLPAKVTDVLAAHAYYACRHLLRYFCTIWKMLSPFHHHFKDRIRTFFHCGEGVVLARKMQKDSITHVHCQYIDHTASVARTIHLLTGISYSISAHTYDIWHDRLLLSHKLSEARFIVCCSASSRTELIKHGHPAHASRVHVVYHGVDTRLFVPPTENGVRNKNLILTVGRLDPVKGFISLIEACRELEELHGRIPARPARSRRRPAADPADDPSERAARVREGAHGGRRRVRRHDGREETDRGLGAPHRPAGERPPPGRACTAGDAACRSRPRRGPARLRETCANARRAAADADFRRRAAGAGDRRVLRRARHPHPRGLRAHGMHLGSDPEHARALPLRHR